MIGRFFTGLRNNIRKLLPMAVVVIVALVAAYTDLFGHGVKETVHALLMDLWETAKPMLKNLLIGLFLVNIAWLLYSPLSSAFEKILCRSGCSPRTKDLSLKLFKFLFWALAVFLLFTFAAADVLGKFVVGFGVFGAALTLSLQGLANDFICGLMIQFSRKINEADNISLDDKIQGKVLSVGYLSTVIDGEGAVIHVPNREIWSRAVRVLKPVPKKSLLWLPPGYYDSDKK